MWIHLFPSRTQKLSTCTPTIVAGWLAVKIGNANTKAASKCLRLSFITVRMLHCAWNCPPDSFCGATIVALTVKIVNANTKSSTENVEVYRKWPMGIVLDIILYDIQLSPPILIETIFFKLDNIFICTDNPWWHKCIDCLIFLWYNYFNSSMGHWLFRVKE